MADRIPLSYFVNHDVIDVARDLLGKTLYTTVDGQVTGGVIVETEAYRGPEDRGSHAWNGRRTPRNEIMYAEGGVVYMYICYGIHDMLNIVTGPAGSSHAVLIRALEPTTGIDVMKRRRGIDDVGRLCKGPGAMARALGLNKLHNGISLNDERIRIEQAERLPDEQIASSARIGLSFGGPYQEIPWRFFIRGSRFVSARKS